METVNQIELPQCGLAEDILSGLKDNSGQQHHIGLDHEKKAEVEVIHHLVTFSLGSEEYGVEIASVREIIRATEITPIPGAPEHVRGVINIRGTIIPVVDLATRFGLTGTRTGDAQRIVVVELGDKKLGMLVDSVSQVIKLPSAIIVDVPEEATSADDCFVKGIGKLDTRLIMILDLKRSLLVEININDSSEVMAV